MKDINLIIDKVAQALGEPVDNLVKLYPQLRTEYSWYYVLDKINYISEFFLIIYGVILFFAVAFIFLEDIPSKQFKTFLISGICIFVLMLIIYVISFVVQGFMCPDILIIKNFIK